MTFRTVKNIFLPQYQVAKPNQKEKTSTCVFKFKISANHAVKINQNKQMTVKPTFKVVKNTSLQKILLPLHALMILVNLGDNFCLSNETVEKQSVKRWETAVSVWMVFLLHWAEADTVSLTTGGSRDCGISRNLKDKYLPISPPISLSLSHLLICLTIPSFIFILSSFDIIRSYKTFSCITSVWCRTL